jgi:cytochrome c553
MTMRRPWLTVLALACVQPAALGDPRDAPPSVRFEHDMIVRFHMHESFDLLRAIEKLLIRGQLEEARTFARAIAHAPDEPGLGAWSQHVVLVRDRAATLATARSVDEACRRAAQLADACAGCHAESGASPEFRSPGRIPPDQPTIDARMARHLWATDRLWEGVVGSADDAWRVGLDVLATTPLQAPELSKEQSAFGRKLQRLADQARLRQGTDAAQDRARSYGEILATCSGCHAAAPAASRPR